MRKFIQYLKDIHLIHSWTPWKEGDTYKVNYKYNPDFWWYSIQYSRVCARCNKVEHKTLKKELF